MNALLFGISLLLGIAIALIVARPARAALPPRSPEELQEEADFVLVGRVEDISRKEIEIAAGTDWYYRVTIAVEAIEQDNFPENREDPEDENPEAMPSVGQPFTVYYRQTGERPAGWAGPVGQYQQPALGLRGRLFLELDPSDRWQLMEPNGWEEIQ